jgi:hypothetical protein
MPHEFTSLGQLHLASLDGDQNGFGRKEIWLPLLDGKQNGFNRHH